MTDITVPVLVVGGGGVGLSSSIFLSNLGVQHLLVERHESTSRLPKAHYLNQRTMEIYRQHGVSDAIYSRGGATINNFGKVRFITSFGGDGPLDRQTVALMDAFGGGSLEAQYTADSPAAPTNLPQLRLEPVLRDEAEDRNPGMIRFGHDVREWKQTDDGVRVVVHDRAADEDYVVTARYVVAADGGKTFGPALGVKMVGLTNVALFVSVHFIADLGDYWPDDILINWLIDPEGQRAAGHHAVVKMGPTWDRTCEEYVAHFALPPDDTTEMSEEFVVPRIRELLKLPDLDIDVQQISRWVLDRVVADQWRFGNVFLAGDAAHRQPPTSGLGLNTGIHDAHNLAWKLAEVVGGRASDELLDSYESERKPVSTFGADWAMLAHANFALTDAALGLTIGAPPEFNAANFAVLISDTPLGRTLRARAERVMSTQSMEYAAHDVELGCVYEHGAVVPDGTPTPERDPFGKNYVPVARPGHRLPHAWLTHHGELVSTHDLVGAAGGFLLITDQHGHGWIEAAEAVKASEGLDISVVAVGDGAPCADNDGTWSKLWPSKEGGAVLVRPDQFTAWVSFNLPDSPADALRAALRSVVPSRVQVDA